MRKKVVFDTVKEALDNYMVDYNPMYESNFATLNISFLKKTSNAKMIEIMQKEILRWIEKYSVPILVCVFDDTGSYVYVKKSENSSLVGWVEPTTKRLKISWNICDLPKYEAEDFKEAWDKIYQEINFRTDKQIKQNADEWVKQRQKKIRGFKFVMLLWFCVIPATWLCIKQFGPKWIGWFVSLYAIVKILIGAKKIYFPKINEQETPEQEKERKMEHYYYHCELNPEGFAKLFIENSTKEARQNIKEEYKNLKNENNANHLQ
jgi:hypothetical protein